MSFGLNSTFALSFHIARFKKRKINFSDNIIKFFDNNRFYCNFMAIAIVFVAILWQFYGGHNRFYCNFMAKTIDFIAILWQ